MPSNKEMVVQAVQNSGEIGVAAISRLLRLDKGTTRKVALEAAREGRVGARNNGSGYVFFPANGVRQSPPSDRNHQAVGHNAVDHRRQRRSESIERPQAGNVIEGEFREVPPGASGRALVVAEQPYDSRTASAVKQLALAKQRALRSPQGTAMGQHVIQALNEFYTADPDGLETLAALQRAEFARAEAERTERERDRQASAMAQQQAVEPSMWDMGMRAAILGFDAYCSMGRQQAEARAAGRQSSATERAEPYEDYFARRQRTKREAEEVKPPSLLDRLRDRARTGTSPEGEAQPPVSNRPESSWWRKHFGTPRRAVWR